MKAINDFNLIQRAWQQQHEPSPEQSNPQQTLKDIQQRLRRYEESQHRIILIKSIAITIILIGLIGLIFFKASPGFFTLSGLGMIFASSLLFIRQFWKLQFKLSSLDFSQNQQDFIQSAIYHINRQYLFFKSKFPYYVVTLILGINLLYLDFLRDTLFPNRWMYHLVATLLFLVMIPLGLKVREFKFNRENKPLLEYLKSIKNQFMEIKNDE